MASRGSAETGRASTVPLDDAAVQATWSYKMLVQFKSPRGITLSVGKAHWPYITDLPDVVFGKIRTPRSAGHVP